MDWKLGVVLGVAVLVGAQVGSRLAVRISEKALKAWTTTLLSVIALRMLAQVIRS